MFGAYRLMLGAYRLTVRRVSADLSPPIGWGIPGYRLMFVRLSADRSRAIGWPIPGYRLPSRLATEPSRAIGRPFGCYRRGLSPTGGTFALIGATGAAPL
jgi:hypothetical protein